MKKVTILLSVLILSILGACATRPVPVPNLPEPSPGAVLVRVDDRGDVAVIELLSQPQIVWEASPKVELHIEIENNPANGPLNTMGRPICSANRCIVDVPYSGGCAIWKYTTRFGSRMMMDPFIIKRVQSGDGK